MRNTYINRFSHVICIAALIIIAVLIGIVFIYFSSTKYTRLSFACATLHNIYEGLLNFNETHGSLPHIIYQDNESNEISSWRIEVYESSIPFLDTKNRIHYNYHKAWCSSDNLRIEWIGAWLFRYTQYDPCPPGKKLGKAGKYTTYYKAIYGSGTAFNIDKSLNLKELPDDLILLVRVEQSDTHWMEPGDIKIDQLTPTNNEVRQLLLSNDGYVVLFADGKGWVLSDKLTYEDLYKFFTVEGAKKYDREKILAPFRIFPQE